MKRTTATTSSHASAETYPSAPLPQNFVHKASASNRVSMSVAGKTTSGDDGIGHGRHRGGATHRSLPLYQGGGAGAPRFVALKAEEALLAVDVAKLDLDALGRYPLLSVNAKTSVSLDFPIGHTCDPTAGCAGVCYASKPDAPARWRKSLVKRLRNLRYITLADPHEVARRLAREFERAQRRWSKRATLGALRINGSGDLFAEVVPVLNIFAANNPNVALWIVTRRFDLAAQISPLPNVYVQLSLDATTPAKLLEAAHALVRAHSRAYVSFLRTSASDDAQDAAIVFNEKHTEGLPYDGVTDCPVDAGRLELGNVRGTGGTACAKCRKCSSDKVLVMQRTLLGRMKLKNHRAGRTS
jgi:hypothetical protein